jgi:hypothetical protein
MRIKWDTFLSGILCCTLRSKWAGPTLLYIANYFKDSFVGKKAIEFVLCIYSPVFYAFIVLPQCIYSLPSMHL